MSTAKLLAKNVIYNFTSQLLLIFLGLVTTPYIIHKLGNQAYGILSITLTVSGFMSLLDIKISSAVIKYISEADAQKENLQMQKLIKVSLTFYVMVGVIGAILIAGLTGFFISKVFKIPAELRGVSYWVFYITAFIFLVQMPTNIFQSVTMGLKRFDIYNKVNVFFTILQLAGSIVLLYLGYYLKAIFLWNGAIAFVELAVFAKAVKNLLPLIKFQIGFEFALFKKIFNFGSKMAIHNICTTAIVNLDKILIGIFLPISFLPFYVIPYNLAQKLQIVPLSFLQVIFPEASGLYGLNKKDNLRELYYRATTYLIIILFPLAVLITIFAKPLLYFWLGNDFAKNSAFVLQVMSITLFLLYSVSMSATILQAIGRPGIIALSGIFVLLIDVIFCLVLIPKFKINGAALAFGFSHIPVTLWILQYTHRNILHIPLEAFFSRIFKLLLLPFGILISYLVLVKIFISSSLFTLLFCVIGLVIYVLLVYFYVLDSKDRQIISSHLAFLK